MFTRLLMWGSYAFLLLVLLPHTAWQFSLFEPTETKNLGWAAAIAFELTIGALTHFLAKELAAVHDVQGEPFGLKLKRELGNIPSFLLLAAILVSTVANWTHAYTFGANIPYGEYVLVKIAYSLLFGAVLPICSFSYAYVLSKTYRKPEQSDEKLREDAAWLTLLNYIKSNPNRDLTPRYLSRMSGVDETTASKIITEAVNTGIITNGRT